MTVKEENGANLTAIVHGLDTSIGMRCSWQVSIGAFSVTNQLFVQNDYTKDCLEELRDGSANDFCTPLKKLSEEETTSSLLRKNY